MRHRISPFVALVALLPALAGAEGLVDRLLAACDGIETVSCQIRKTTEAGSNTVRRLSRVYYQKPDRIHVENVSPLERRYVADGEKLYYYISGDPRGYAKPIPELEPKWLMELRKVPGTAMDHLMRLEGIPETDLEPTAEFPVRKGYAAEKVYAVLSLDSQGRLARIEFYDSAAMAERTGQYDYSEFREAVPGAWIACLHTATVLLNGLQITETVHIDDLLVNQPISPEQFDVGRYFKGIEFVETFDRVYE